MINSGTTRKEENAVVDRVGFASENQLRRELKRELVKELGTVVKHRVQKDSGKKSPSVRSSESR